MLSLGLIFLTSTVSAQEVDDTFSCLEELTGEVISIVGDQGYANYDYFGLEEGTRIDARTALYFAQNY
jgi:hypothetical protein